MSLDPEKTKAFDYLTEQLKGQCGHEGFHVTDIMCGLPPV